MPFAIPSIWSARHPMAGETLTSLLQGPVSVPVLWEVSYNPIPLALLSLPFPLAACPSVQTPHNLFPALLLLMLPSPFWTVTAEELGPLCPSSH